ncbi:enoyl-CoA hydratase family protein [Corynebacterium freneyi]|uniref:enoyl-CoA hydratase family protein n=1 Tax=Corynebacterium freneyi TaxID=134034 RepID=UPI00254B9D9C|nr:enoyl-CoA hydratase family protein [Corynebacterium freneyi]MDK8768908.1 enoyl-CoA hydratase family protein [Corynebacterium freneyi]
MPINYRTDAGVAFITLDEPAKRNALSPEMIGEVSDHLAAAVADSHVRSVIIDHAGSTFCSGADLGSAKASGVEAAAGNFLGLLRSIVAAPKPVIAVVDGHVRAGGMGLLSACDVAFVSPSSTFGAPEPRIGVAPALIALTVLPRLGSRAAARHLLSGDVFDAAEAARIGLVTEVADDPAAAAAAYAADLLVCSPQGLAETKALLNHAILEAFDQRGSELAATSSRLFASSEAKEGMAAFLSRRRPAWAEPTDSTRSADDD